ncbi:unnamed protein product [Vicia faba]|uniref:Uncharacterized protein n=1 Tax=Vicia faba TaxID=3906 RepID=A0AAV0ZXR3_VICFA|nr:unnamed protein product [Vicia faba]
MIMKMNAVSKREIEEIFLVILLRFPPLKQLREISVISPEVCYRSGLCHRSRIKSAAYPAMGTINQVKPMTQPSNWKSVRTVKKESMENLTETGFCNFPFLLFGCNNFVRSRSELYTSTVGRIALVNYVQ